MSSGNNSKGSVYQAMALAMKNNKALDSLKMSIQQSNVTLKEDNAISENSEKAVVKIKDGFKLDPETGE